MLRSVLETKITKQRSSFQERNRNWKEGLEGFVPAKGHQYYYVNIKGEVYSLKRYKFMGHIITNGYWTVRLHNNDTKVHRTISIHRLIAENFLPNPENKPFINHIDGNRLNNNIDNLEWCTPKENIQHAFKLGLIDRTKSIGVPKKKKLNLEQVLEIKKLLNDNVKTKDIANKFEVGADIIRSIKNNNYHQK